MSATRTVSAGMHLEERGARLVAVQIGSVPRRVWPQAAARSSTQVEAQRASWRAQCGQPVRYVWLSVIVRKDAAPHISSQVGTVFTGEHYLVPRPAGDGCLDVKHCVEGACLLGAPAVVGRMFGPMHLGDTVAVDVVQRPTDISERRLVVNKTLCGKRAMSVCL